MQSVDSRSKKRAVLAPRESGRQRAGKAAPLASVYV